jgi:5'(3')-deoxyribonucleotidase
MKPRLALDLDDIIYPFIDQVVPFLNRELRRDLGHDDVVHFTFEDLWECEGPHMIDLMHQFFEEVRDSNALPVDGSLEAVEALSEQFDLAIVTSRQSRMHETTAEWIEQHFPGRFSSVTLCNSYVFDGRWERKLKADVCGELGVVALVDDSLEHTTAVAAKGIRGIVFGDFPWNQSDTLPAGVTRAPDWNSVIRQIREMAAA